MASLDSGISRYFLACSGRLRKCGNFCSVPQSGIGFTGVALAFGLTVATGAYAFGPISGGHFNPAVSVGLWGGGRFPGSRVLPYVISQLLGA